MAELAVSAFAANFARMGRDVRVVARNGADALHVDVMDGNFVPSLGLGPAWLRSLGRETVLPALDIHLMTLDPATFATRLFEFRPRSLVFQLESEPSPESAGALLRAVKARGIACGLALSPGTALVALGPFLGLVDEVLIMASQPGREGASFEESTFDRVSEAREMIDGRAIGISVDGGLDESRAAACVARGATRIVMGRSFFASRRKRALVRRIHALGSRTDSRRI